MMLCAAWFEIQIEKAGYSLGYPAFSYNKCSGVLLTSSTFAWVLRFVLYYLHHLLHLSELLDEAVNLWDVSARAFIDTCIAAPG